MNVALCPLRMKVVSANAASPSGAGSATGRASAGAARTSSATTAMTCLPSFEPSLGQPKHAGAERPKKDIRNPIYPIFELLNLRLGRQVVRVFREVLGPVRRDEHEVLEPAAAEAAAVEAGLDRDDVAREELLADLAERRLLVHLEPYPVAEAVEEAVDEHLALLLRAQGGVAVALEDVAGDLEEVPPGRAGADLAEGAVERLLDEQRVLGELVRRCADDEGARHVRVAAGRPVARIQVEHDRLVGRDRTRARVVADGGLCSVRDDRIVGRDAVVAEDALDRGLQPLAGQRLAGEAKHAV